MIILNRILHIYIFLFLGLISYVDLFSQTTNKKILVLHSYHVGYVWTDSIEAGIQSVTNKINNVDVYVEYLDGKRYDDSAYFNKIVQVYKHKYKRDMFDIIILSDNIALEFALVYGNEIFGNIPVVYCGVNNPQRYNLSHLPYYGILETEQDEPVLKQMIAMLPLMKNIYFISDSTQNGIADLNRIVNITKRLPATISYKFINSIDVDSLFKNVTKINNTDAIFLISLQRDRYGNGLNYGRLTKQLCDISPVPIFCSYFSNIGKGVVGGCFVNAVTQGQLSAELALNILFKPNFSPEKITIPIPEYYFDYEALNKFSIPLSTLPQKYTLINKPESIYSRYKKAILISLSIISFLVFIIVMLLTNIQRRKKAEVVVAQQFDEIQKKNEEISLVNKYLNDSNTELEISNETLSRVNHELVIAKEHAEESDKLKTAFLQNVSHEIRTPMHAIIGFSSLLKNFYNNKSELEKYTAIINQHCNDLLVIINDVLDIAKIESGMLDIKISKCNVNELFDELSLFFVHHYKHSEKQHVNLIMQCDSNITINTDRVKLKQILINLISNAFKFTNEGTIEVSCVIESENKITFTVADTGIGISPDKQRIIFERFAQIDNSNTRMYGGTGLGLSIVKGLLQLIGGQIFILSELGKGSQFTFILPYEIKDLK